MRQNKKTILNGYLIHPSEKRKVLLSRFVQNSCFIKRKMHDMKCVISECTEQHFVDENRRRIQ